MLTWSNIQITVLFFVCFIGVTVFHVHLSNIFYFFPNYFYTCVYWGWGLMVFNVTFNNISVISCIMGNSSKCPHFFRIKIILPKSPQFFYTRTARFFSLQKAAKTYCLINIFSTKTMISFVMTCNSRFVY